MRAWLFSVLVVAGCWLAWAGNTTAADIFKTDVEISATAETVILHLDSPLAPTREFVLENPPRLVIDLPASVSGKGVGLNPRYPGGLIRNIRFGHPTPDISRIVIDLAHEPKNYRVMGSLNPPRIAVVLPSATSAPAIPSSQLPSLGTLTQKKNTASGAASLPTATTKTVTSPAPLIPAPSPKPLAALKEAQKPLIVIDAGHGGKDTGAISVSGTHEKNITLAYAGALKDALLQSGHYRVALTRQKDVYLFLRERVDIARAQKAAAFISLHADSNPNARASGLSIYTISDEASDAETEALAAQENKSDIIGGIDLAIEDKDVANILLDMAQRETRSKGALLADTLIANMNSKIPLLSNTHRYAGFRVLKAPDIPSVLIEIGFLSSPQDEKRVQSAEYKDKFVRSVVLGLDRYFTQNAQ